MEEFGVTVLKVKLITFDFLLLDDLFLVKLLSNLKS